MSSGFEVIPGYIIGGGKLIDLEEIRKRVEVLGKVSKTGGKSFRLVPYNQDNSESLDFDEMYPTVYFNSDYSLDFYISNLKYEMVTTFIEKLSDVLGVPIDYAAVNDGPNTEDDQKKLEKFLEKFGGYYGRGKKQSNLP